jgi:hypothetical protein
MSRIPLPLAITLDHELTGSRTTAQWFGANVLAIATVIARPGFAVTLTSTYVGTGRVRTHVTHLQQGPMGVGTIEAIAFGDGMQEEHSKVLYRPLECLDDHARRMLGWLHDLGRDVRIELGEGAVQLLQTA